MENRLTASPDTPKRTFSRGHLAQWLESRQAQGKLVCALDDYARSEGLTRPLARRQFERLGTKVARLPGRPSLYLTVPPEDRPRGAPPVSAWLHDYLSQRVPHYYVSLLSAAAVYGSQHQVPLVTQVIVPLQLRPFDLGRLRVEFFLKQGTAHTPLEQLSGLAAPLNVSTPAATLLDLVAFSPRVGGLARVAEVAKYLLPRLKMSDLKQALEAGVAIPVVQRTGYLLEALGAESLARITEGHLTAAYVPVPLQVGRTAQGAPLHDRWRILRNIELEGSPP